VADDFARRAAVASICSAALIAYALSAATAATSHGSPPALYTKAQAAAGAKLYASTCAQCHGANLEGGVGPALRGPNLQRLAQKTKLTVGDFFQFLALQMPLNAPASLPKDQYASIMAYILSRNGYPAGPKPLTYDAATKSNVIITTYPGH
jgi:polar amino acid transport system substrate-binding protein